MLARGGGSWRGVVCSAAEAHVGGGSACLQVVSVTGFFWSPRRGSAVYLGRSAVWMLW